MNPVDQSTSEITVPVVNEGNLPSLPVSAVPIQYPWKGYYEEGDLSLIKIKKSPAS